MLSFSLWHWLIVLIVIVGWVVPVALILKRLGYSGWWSILSFIPLGSVIGMWVVALIRWPIPDAKENAHISN